MQQLVLVVSGVAVDPALLGQRVQHAPPLGVTPRALGPGEIGEDVQTTLSVQGGQPRKQPSRLELRQTVQASVDPFGEFARRLPGERQA